MKNLKQYLNEKLIINKNYNKYQYKPKTWDELRQIIEDRYYEFRYNTGTAEEPVDFNDVDVSGINSFYNDNSRYKGIFAYTDFEYIDISEWNVSNVKDMCCMFKECYCLKSTGDLSNWDVSSVKKMNGMFAGCKNLENIGDIENWDLLKIEETANMFSACSILKSIGNISNWNISNIRNMWHMFYNSGITNIPKWYKG